MATDAQWIYDDTGLIDLNFQDTPRVIGAYLLPTRDGLALIECGPSSTIDNLVAGIQALGHDPADLRHILVTHIHLDHAGAAGSLMAGYPNVRLYVHEVGAPHMVDPSALIRSATRIYGDQMERLWADILPVPEDRVTVIRDGDTIEIGGRALQALYTPGHASHHVAYADEGHRVIFSGDVAGVRIPPSPEVWPPTPPPDIDIDAWHRSVATLRERNPERLLLTHFGPFTDVESHLQQLEERLDQWVAFVGDLEGEGVERDAIVERLGDLVRSEMADRAGPDLESSFALTTPHGMSVDGLLRYLRKRREAAERGG
ncbi:MAG: MBL fold metallo-hydrolase [Chloroflexota bacterium]|nr:MBL fold metallo-hydrolase [Chloroflexota bacterium]